MQSERVSTRRLSTQNAEPRCFTEGAASASFSLKRMNIYHVSFDAGPTTMHGSSRRGERLRVCRTHVSPGAPAAGSISIPAKPLQLRGHEGSRRPACTPLQELGADRPRGTLERPAVPVRSPECLTLLHVGSDCICIHQNRMQV